MKKSQEDESIPCGFYPLTTSTPKKEHHVRIQDRIWPMLMKVQGAKDEIEAGKAYWIDSHGFYDRNDEGAWIY